MKRFVTASLTIFMFLASLLAVNVGTAQHASAAQSNSHVGEQMRNFATNLCLAADYANIYSYDCSVSNQKWTTIDKKSNNDFRLRNEATKQCLANLDFYTVYMTSCSSVEPGIWWHADYAQTARSFVVNTHINRYLSTDFSRKVYLAPKVSNQNWTWQPPIVVKPMDCLAAWDNNADYFASGWVGAKVADVNGVFLGCGDVESGIIHIAHPVTSGTRHPISTETQDFFVRCFRAIAQYGSTFRDRFFPDDRTRYNLVYDYPSPTSTNAAFIRDNRGGFVYTMYTGGLPGFNAPTNNWAGCTSGTSA